MKEPLEKWYIILRRLLFVIPLYMGFCLSFASFALGWGIETAVDWWKKKDLL